MMIVSFCGTDLLRLSSTQLSCLAEVVTYGHISMVAGFILKLDCSLAAKSSPKLPNLLTHLLPKIAQNQQLSTLFN